MAAMAALAQDCQYDEATGEFWMGAKGGNSDPVELEMGCGATVIARASYCLADAMLKARDMDAKEE